MQVHPGAAKWQNTAMLWFKELSIIFGKDRATRNLAENLADVVEELNKEADADELSGQDGMQPSAHSDESEEPLHLVFTLQQSYSDQPLGTD